jgi:radical SAM protein with 4Fe4S-binding SPASM domain
MAVPSYKLACAVWEFTRACNLNCVHCGSSAGKKREDELSTPEALKLCVDLKEAGCRGVALMGGEPFLREDFWSVAAKIKELGMELSVITNGTVFSGGIFEKLKALKPRAVAVSVDASSAELHDRIRGVPGAYEKSWTFINRALEESLPVSVITTVHKLNLKELPAIRDRLKGRGIAWQVQTAGAEGRRFSKDLLLDEEEFYSVGIFVEACRRTYSVEELPVIGAHDLGYNSGILKNISLYEKWEGCQAGVSVLGIRSNGEVMGCLAMNDEGFMEGNIRGRSVSEIWNDPEAFSYTRRFKASDAGPNCSGCGHIEACKGGCNEMSLMKSRALHNDPYCFYKLERRLFAEELNNPLKRFLFRLNGLAHSPGALKKLSAIFSGKIPKKI